MNQTDKKPQLKMWQMILMLFGAAFVVLLVLVVLSAASYLLASQIEPPPPNPISWEPAMLEDCPQGSALRAAGCPCWISRRDSIKQQLICDPISP